MFNKMRLFVVVLLILGLCEMTDSVIMHYHINEYMTWTDARDYCRLYYEDLSTIHNMKELKKLSADDVELSWIGLYREVYNQSYQWKWSDGENAHFRYWSLGEPTALFTDNCVLMEISNKKWSAAGCSLLYTFFCMKTFTGFMFVQQNKTWEDALDYCRSSYSDLASLQSDEDNALAVNVSQDAQTPHVWTGLRFLAGQWFWVSGDDLNYQAWETEGQFQCPARNLRCGALETNRGIWKPQDCEERLNFLCF